MARASRAGKLCTRCTRVNTTQRYALCTKCRQTARARPGIREYQRAYNEELRQAGICRLCKDTAQAGKTTCFPCGRAEAAKRLVDYYAALDKKCCPKCRRKRRTYGKANKYRLCRYCLSAMRAKRRKAKTYDCKKCGVGQRAYGEAVCGDCSRVGVGTKAREYPYVVESLRRNPGASVYDLANDAGVSVRTVLRHLNVLKAKGLVERWTENATAHYRIKSDYRLRRTA